MFPHTMWEANEHQNLQNPWVKTNSTGTTVSETCKAWNEKGYVTLIMWHINCSFKNILSQIASVFCVSKITTCSKNGRERYDKTSSFATYLAPVNVGNFGKPNYSWHVFLQKLWFLEFPSRKHGRFILPAEDLPCRGSITITIRIPSEYVYIPIPSGFTEYSLGCGLVPRVQSNDKGFMFRMCAPISTVTFHLVCTIIFGPEMIWCLHHTHFARSSSNKNVIKKH